MLKKIQQKIKSLLNPEPKVVVTDNKTNLRVLCPKGYAAYFFKNVVIVAPNERDARRQYEYMLRKEIKLQAGENRSK
jgi:hypothetical protein